VSGAEGPVEKLRRWTASALASVTIAKAIPVIAEEYDFDDAETALRQIWAALDERHGELATALTTAEARNRELEAALCKLAAEVSGLEAAEAEVRGVIGNTNWNVLMLRRAEALRTLRGE